tara:strand:- start:410 stop:2050 length:1641 start_codon:yes stop_codon:yes gene_type:complete
MGLLVEDKILSWKDTQNYTEYYKTIALKQFVNIYNKYKNNIAKAFYWGYETEYMLVKKCGKDFKLNLKGTEIIKKMKNKKNKNCWLPEYSEWMVEKIADKPFNSKIKNIESIEYILNKDLNQINRELKENEYAILLSCFPLLGDNKNIFNLKEKLFNNYSESELIPDNIINKHIRFKTLTENIKKRRGKKVSIKRNIFQDILTDTKEINMDCMAFGMGNCCSQITIQCKNIDQAFYLYDQFAILSPLLLHLSSATPFIKGYLTESQNRWKLIEQAVDDRKNDEDINKSRYSSISRFIHKKGQKYNNLNETYNHDCYDYLKKNGIPENLNKHISHLFLRDPIIMYEKDIEKDINSLENEKDFFVNINSSNWNNVRLKPPLSDKESWKVEIRMLDIQTNNFKNASFIIYILLLARTIIHYNLNFYIPMSYIEDNYNNIELNTFDNRFYTNHFWNKNRSNFSPKLIDMGKIINKINNFIRNYISEIKENIDVERYLVYIENISNQKEKTDAGKMHDFIINHEEYKNDSKINNNISNELIQSIINNLFIE